MKRKSPIVSIWFLFFCATVIYNVAIFLDYSQIVSLNFVHSFAGREANYLFYVLLLMTLGSVAVSLFWTDKIRLGQNTSSTPEKINFTQSIIKMAFAEAIGLYGFVFFVLTGLAEKSLFFGSISFVFLVLIYPHESKIT